jgi:hypothetical protein
MKNIVLAVSWLFVTGLTLGLVLAFNLSLSAQAKPNQRPRQEYIKTETLTSKPILPEVLGAFSFSVKTDDAVPEIIKNYLKKYNSPLLPDADYLIQVARQNNFDPRLLVAIAQQESNLCKKIPENSFNCWGWGIHSRGTLRFDSYREAIDAVSFGLAKNYLGKGLMTPEEIMAIYTPLSEGSWARGVQQFLNEME